MITHVVTIEELEQQISKLSLQDQLRLVARVSERLSVVVMPTQAESQDDEYRARRLAEVDAWITEADVVAELWEGEFDSAEDIRRMREDRDNQLLTNV
jgi:hypothetical protein